MIPLTRRNAARGASLVSYTRQSLPRPARLYSTPTKKLDAEAVPSPAGLSMEYPPFMPSSSSSIHNDMHGFLRRPAQYTILPTPLPADAADETHQHLFTDSPTQDRIAVMDACLHDLHDVPRAKEIFELLRESMRGDQLLDVRLYNHFLQAFFEMATRKESNNHAHWLEEAWILYNEMEAGREGVQPTANTYAIMLRMWLRFNPASESPVQISAAEMHDPMSLLRNMLRGSVAPALVVADRAFTTSEEATEAIKALSRAAVEMGLSSVVNELGLADSLGRQVDDPLEDVPEAIPVMKTKDLSAAVEAQRNEDGTVSQFTTDQPAPRLDGDIPFNLGCARRARCLSGGPPGPAARRTSPCTRRGGCPSESEGARGACACA